VLEMFGYLGVTLLIVRQYPPYDSFLLGYGELPKVMLPLPAFVMLEPSIGVLLLGLSLPASRCDDHATVGVLSHPIAMWM